MTNLIYLIICKSNQIHLFHFLYFRKTLIESFNCVLHDKVLLLNCNSPKVMTPDSETEEKKSEILTEENHDPSSSKAIHHEFLFGSCGKKELQRDETLKGISRKQKYGPSGQNYPNIKRTVQLSAAKERLDGGP